MVKRPLQQQMVKQVLQQVKMPQQVQQQTAKIAAIIIMVKMARVCIVVAELGKMVK